MQLAARPCVVAGVSLAVAGLVTAVPVVTPRPDLQAHSIRLTAGLQGLLDAQLDLSSSLTKAFLNGNGQLVDTQHELTPDIATLLGANVHDDGSVHGLAKDAVEQFFNANNALTEANQAGLLGLLGVRGTMDGGAFTPLDLEGLNESLLVDPQHAGSIPFAGLESAVGHYIGAAAFLSGSLSGASDDDVENGATGEAFGKLVADVTAFNNALLEAEKTFNTTLVGDELHLEDALFGTDSAVNGAVNRAFNAFNMAYDAQQQSFNGLLGLTGYDPQDYTDSLLTGSGGAAGQVFNDGSVGGLMGMFDQQLAGLFDLAGASGSTGSPDGFTADPAAVSDALTALFGTLQEGPYGDVFAAGGAFSVLLADVQSLFTEALGS